MHYTYVLLSDKDGRFYTGCTADIVSDDSSWAGATSWNGTSNGAITGANHAPAR